MTPIVIILLVILIVYTFIYFFPNEDTLQKYYYIENEKVYAKMDIHEYTDLGVISIHTDDALRRVKDTCNNEIHYTSQNIPWRKHREIGKYIHHSEYPNCEIYRSSPMSFGLRSTKSIKAGQEITTDYYPLHTFYEMKV